MFNFACIYAHTFVQPLTTLFINSIAAATTSFPLQCRSAKLPTPHWRQHRSGQHRSEQSRSVHQQTPQPRSGQHKNRSECQHCTYVFLDKSGSDNNKHNSQCQSRKSYQVPRTNVSRTSLLSTTARDAALYQIKPSLGTFDNH